MKLEGIKRENGKYFEKFDTAKEARDYIHKLKRKYLYAPNPKNVSIRKLCRFARNEGVMIDKNHLSKCFKELGVELRVNRPRERKRYPKNVTLNENVIEELENYPNQSYLTEFGLKIVMGIPTKDVIIFLPVEDDEDPINVIFKEDDGKISAIATGELKKRDKNEISAVLRKAQSEGMDAVMKHIKLLGYESYGGTK